MNTMTITRQEFDDLVDAKDHAVAMRDVATGAMELFTEAEVEAYVAAATPLVFWRQKREMSQAELAAAIGVSQPYVAQIESGKRVGDVNLYGRIAKVLKVKIDDLVEG